MPYPIRGIPLAHPLENLGGGQVLVSVGHDIEHQRALRGRPEAFWPDNSDFAVISVISPLENRDPYLRMSLVPEGLMLQISQISATGEDSRVGAHGVCARDAMWRGVALFPGGESRREVVPRDGPQDTCSGVAPYAPCIRYRVIIGTESDLLASLGV